MAKFDDPTTWPADYAPGLHHPKGRKPAWRAPQRYVQAGWTPARVEVPEDEVVPVCRRLTRELLQWWAKQAPSAEDFGTWAYVIRRYRTDTYSPYATVKESTREEYDYCCNAWIKAIGHWRISDLTFERMKQIEHAMRDKGRSDAYVHRMFKHLRMFTRYGAVLQETKTDCRDVKETLSNMRIKAPSRQSHYPTREQIEAVVEKADAGGDSVWATGILVQFEFILRAVDVRGQWLATDEAEGGIIRNGKRWQDGMTWGMFDEDLTRFTKVISKTAKSLPEPYTFDLTSVPYLLDRIARMRPERAVGPVFRNKAGYPYDKHAWGKLWRKYAKQAGVPPEVKVMDVRAGGATEAREAGAAHFDLRDAAQHKNVSTTSGYVRGRSVAADKVVQLRQRNRNKSE